MPRARSDSVVTHRLELGVWERKQFEQQAIPRQVEAGAKAAGYLMLAGAAGIAAWGLYWFFDAGWGIRSNITDYWDKRQEEAGLSDEEMQHYGDMVAQAASGGPGGILVKPLRWFMGV